MRKHCDVTAYTDTHTADCSVVRCTAARFGVHPALEAEQPPLARSKKEKTPLFLQLSQGKHH